MTAKTKMVALVVSLLVVVISGCCNTTLTPTEEYIRDFDVEEYELRGSDYTNPRYSLSRLDKPPNEIDRTYDYDFELVSETYYSLSLIDRPTALVAIFNKVTAGCETELQRHLAMLEFLHKVSYHNVVQPMHENGKAVFDPLVLLELNEMRCGAVARLGVDLYQSVGYDARLVQMANHVSAEVYYESRWHLLEGGLAGGGQTVVVDGVIPSVYELSHNPLLIDMIPAYLEWYVAAALIPPTSSPPHYIYPSYYYFSKNGYVGLSKPLFYYKTLPITEEEDAEYSDYGWYDYDTVLDTDRILSDISVNYQPTIPYLDSVTIKDRTARITWNPSEDPDGDLLGYIVYVSSSSRGWHYSTFPGDESVERYWQGGWEPSMYDALFRIPPHDLALIITTNTSINIPLNAGETKYFTVAAFDEHGASVGKELYYCSAELKLENQ